MMTTRLERDVGRRPGCRCPRLLQRLNFRVMLAGPFMPAFPDNLIFMHDDAAHAGVRIHCIQTTLGELKRPGHIPVIIGGCGHFLSSGSNDI